MLKGWKFIVLAGCVFAGSGIVASWAAPKNAIEKEDAAVERARREVRLLDDIYKTTVVLVTEHYVKDESSLSAGSAARALFAEISKKGWHDARLVDATGQPYSEQNVARAGFEKKAVEALLAGKSSYDEVITDSGKRYLLAATPIPVVMDKCIMCHENYRNVPKGKAIGAISYRVPVVE